MIVVDASALLEALLRTPAADALERRLFDDRQTLHARPTFSILRSRRSSADTRRQVISPQSADARRSPISTISRCIATRMPFCCRAFGNYEAI